MRNIWINTYNPPNVHPWAHIANVPAIGGAGNDKVAGAGPDGGINVAIWQSPATSQLLISETLHSIFAPSRPAIFVV